MRRFHPPVGDLLKYWQIARARAGSGRAEAVAFLRRGATDTKAVQTVAVLQSQIKKVFKIWKGHRTAKKQALMPATPAN